jgi:hypothetical protein
MKGRLNVLGSLRGRPPMRVTGASPRNVREAIGKTRKVSFRHFVSHHPLPLAHSPHLFLFSHNLHYHIPLAWPVIKFQKNNLLPCTQ